MLISNDAYKDRLWVQLAAKRERRPVEISRRDCLLCGYWLPAGPMQFSPMLRGNNMRKSEILWQN